MKPVAKIDERLPDWLALIAVAKAGERSALLPKELLYRACAAAANAGTTLEEEKHLERDQRLLVEVRKLIYAQNFQGASRLLESAAFQSRLLAGDARSLRAILVHRTGGDTAQAIAFMRSAAQIFAEIDETHRMLRVEINALIFVRDLTDYEGGKLLALERECLRLGHPDLAGFIRRGRAIELCTKGDFGRALRQAELADQSFELSGCPEDRALAKALLAILYRLCGMEDRSLACREQISIEGGRIAGYLAILDAIENGEVPRLDPSHVLAKTPWRKSAALLKPGSVLGKLRGLLASRDLDKDELIAALWGDRAKGPAYENRLRVALTKLRKNHSIPVRFDGSRYSIERQEAAS